MMPAEPAELGAFEQPELAVLWSEVRANLERRSLRVDGGRVTLRELSDAEMAAVCSLLGRRRPNGSTVVVDVAQLDSSLREGRHGLGVVEVLERIGGPMRDRPHERASTARDRDALQRLLLDHRAASDERVERWIASLRSRGRLTRLGVTAPDESVAQALDVVSALLEREGGAAIPTPLPVLAAQLTGDAHGLDDDRIVGHLVADAVQALSGVLSLRRAWSMFAVDVDAVNSSVLVLGLPGASGSIVESARRHGEPLRMTSRMLRSPDILGDVSALVVFVCENPSIVAAAADEVGPSSAALVCTDGMPKSVTGTLLTRLVSGGAELRVHADFDVGGVAIVGHVTGSYGAAPWRFSTHDYVAALERPSRELTGHVGSTSWDDQLSTTMNATARAVHEEAVVDQLLDDLRDG